MAELIVRGCISLPSPERFEDAVAIVALDDVTYVDAESTRIAGVTIAPLHGVYARIPFSLRIEASLLRASASYTITAEIRTTRKEALLRGDFLTMTAHPWSPENNQIAKISVQRI